MSDILQTFSGRIKVPGFEECRPVRDYRTTYPDPDGLTRHGVLRFRFNLFEEK
jgi:hypothetical protein